MYGSAYINVRWAAHTKARDVHPVSVLRLGP